MKACSHFSEEEHEVYIIESDGFPWNAWILVYSSSKLIFSSFETGLFLEFLEHLTKNPECLKESGKSEGEILEKLQEIKKEWEIVNK